MIMVKMRIVAVQCWMQPGQKVVGMGFEHWPQKACDFQFSVHEMTLVNVSAPFLYLHCSSSAQIYKTERMQIHRYTLKNYMVCIEV
jgi:hypothetical protein